METDVRTPLTRRGVGWRRMTATDIDTVAEIEGRAYPFPWSRELFADCLRAGYRSLLCTVGDTVIGYGIMIVAAGECHVLNVCIDPGFQRLGLGHRLMARLLTQAKQDGADTAFLEVRPTNVGALRLYDRLGFQRIGVRAGYYPALSGREDAVVLSCNL